MRDGWDLASEALARCHARQRRAVADALAGAWARQRDRTEPIRVRVTVLCPVDGCTHNATVDVRWLVESNAAWRAELRATLRAEHPDHRPGHADR